MLKSVLSSISMQFSIIAIRRESKQQAPCYPTPSSFLYLQIEFLVAFNPNLCQISDLSILLRYEL